MGSTAFFVRCERAIVLLPLAETRRPEDTLLARWFAELVVGSISKFLITP